MKGYPLLVELEITEDTNDNTLSLSEGYDANGDGNPEAAFSDSHLFITAVEGSVSMTGNLKIVVDNRNTIVSEDDNSGTVTVDRKFNEQSYYGEPVPVYGQITVKKSAAPSAASKIRFYVIVVPNEA